MTVTLLRVARDAWHACRALARQPAFAAAAVLTLALGIALNTTVFSAASALALRPVPGRNHDRVVVLSETMPAKFGKWAATMEDLAIVSPANLTDWERQATTLDSFAAFTDWDASVTGIAEPEQVAGARVAPRLFELLGARPEVGRVFAPNETNVVILSDGFWKRRFGGDRSAVGRRITVNGVSATIVGVMGADFIFPKAAELWTPLELTAKQLANRGSRWLNAVGRLRPGSTVTDAQTEASTIAARLASQYPTENAGWGFHVSDADAFYGRGQRATFGLLLAATGCVLLIACANVAGLLLARTTIRARELAVRVALGATRWHLIRQLLVEGAVVAFAGGSLGALLSLWGVRLFRGTLPAELVLLNPGWTRITVDARALSFTLGASLLSALLTGIMPAVNASRADPQRALVAGGRGSVGAERQRARSTLVVLELALASVLLVVGAATGRAFIALVHANPGYATGRVMTMEITLPAATYGNGSGRAGGERIVAFFDALMNRARALPGVMDAGVSNLLPPSWDETHISLTLEGERAEAGHPSADPVRLYVVSPNYLQLLGIPVVRGRGLTHTDRQDSPPVALVSESLARRNWPGVDVIGKRIRLAGPDSVFTEIVGVVRDVEGNPNIGAAKRRPTVYVPLAQLRWGNTMSLVVRTAGAPELITAMARKEIAHLDPAVAPGRVMSLERMLESSVSPQRRTALMVGVFAALSLVLAAVGIYGIVAYSVAQRTNEIGVRMALGATRRQVVGGVLRQSGRVVAAGLAVGVAGAMAAARLMPRVMSDVGRVDASLVFVVVTGLAAVALLASYLPARRAARVDPLVALRSD